ncbi:Xaa-Pro aminopeptidase [Cobetia sp. 3AK]|uniref:Xaa-Pro aminopeptidase n=1 Tax=Cobetia sp. 3AK TaxID=3040020 RepID=UPI00244D51BA|nr:Xaa-Pro aminopeptidase [Cobetia sp. 3AK]MDH2374284.1 Xaa-Pro aminopeptidase [Cobetia sp. 3AK]
MVPEILPAPAALTADDFSARRQRLMTQLPRDAAVLVLSSGLAQRNRDSEFTFRQNSDFHYLTGWPEPEAALLLLPGRAEGESVLFCQEKDPLAEAWTGIRIGAEGAVTQAGFDQAFTNDQREDVMAGLLDGRGRLFVLFEDDEALALAQSLREELAAAVRRGARPPVAFEDLAPLLHEQRLIKDERELALMRHAAEISARAHIRAMRASRPGLHEYHLQAEIEHEFQWQGAPAPAYTSIVGGGVNACVLHYIENRAPLIDGELVLIDAGAEYALYAGDITRTFPVNGRFSEPQKRLYEIVLKAQERAVAAVVPGATLVGIHQQVVHDLTAGLVELGLLQGEVEALIADEAYRRFYLHSTSHWLGLDVHDVGSYRENGEPRPLLPGMVLTVEPGLYVPDASDISAEYRGIGIRIEDDVVVTADGHEVLSATVPKSVEAIEALMREGA